MFKKNVFTLLVVMGLSVGSVSAADSWRWKVNGLWVYGDQYPAGVKDAERLGTVSVSNVSSGSTDSGLVNEKAAKDFPVFLYGVGCSGCNEARKVLDGRKIKYETKDPSILEVYKEFKELSPQAMAPVIKIGSKSLIGFESSALNGALDDAGYAKNNVPSDKQ